jgi:hypothetical protein
MPTNSLFRVFAMVILCGVLLPLPVLSAEAPPPGIPPAVLSPSTQVPADVVFPPPRMEGGKPLLAALKERQTRRAFSAEALPQQLLGDLLWAAAGINRPESGRRTAPTARNWQEIDVYVLLPEGAYLYDPSGHALRGIVAGDLRALSGKQDFVASAALNLVFTADATKIVGAQSPEDILFYGAVDSGFVSQNVYLFCASEGLATVVRAMVDREVLSQALGLPATKRITLAQSVGFPAP